MGEQRTVRAKIQNLTRNSGTTTPTSVKGVTIHQLTQIDATRGSLCAGEFERQIPFVPKRFFMVFDVPADEVRGKHAHHRCRQFLLCPRGSVAVVVDDGRSREEIVLDRPDIGVFIPPMVWGEQHKYSPDALLLVFASDFYDPDDYIRDYGQFQGAL